MDLSREPLGRVIDLRGPIAMAKLKRDFGAFGPQTPEEGAEDVTMRTLNEQRVLNELIAKHGLASANADVDPLHAAVAQARAQRAIPNAAVPRPVIDDSGQVVQREGKSDPNGIDDSGQVVQAEAKSDNLEAATGEIDPAAAEVEEDPRAKPRSSSFFDQPGATEALSAFGAAMLKAPTFNEGLGDAAIAVSQVEQKYRMPSDAEIARARMGSARYASSKIEEVSQRKAAAEEMGLDPNSEEYKQYVLTGKLPDEDGGPRITATDKKAIFEAENDMAELDNTESVLQRAIEINDQTFTGALAGAKGTIGTSDIPGTNVLVDRKKAEATREWSQTMSQEAIKAMADSLKGATTNYELQEFVKQLADPSTPHPIRLRILQRMHQLAQLKRQIVKDRMDQIRGGNYYTPEGGQSGRPDAQPKSSPAPKGKQEYGDGTDQFYN